MGAWIVLWKAVFVIGLTIFAGMAVWVSVQGFRDIRTLLETISRRQRKARPGKKR